MFVALRDLRFAKGRFLLIGSVVALITILAGFLSGLTGGLANQNISAILAMPADRIVFSAPAAESGPGFADSSVTQQQAENLATAVGISAVEPVGVTQTRAEVGDRAVAIAAFGVQPSYAASAPSSEGLLSLSLPAADELGAQVGDEIAIAGKSYVVESIAGDGWYSHTPVVQMTLADWQDQAAATGSPDAYATVLAVTGSANWAALDTSNGTVSKSPLQSLTALAAFQSEVGSLLLMVTMLFGISGLMIGAFFTVWTMQRKGDIAVLKALGASTASLVRDALGQALIVLLAGIGLGFVIVILFGSVAGGALPFLLSPLTTILPGAIMVTLGLAGAAFALRSVTAADPLTALGSNR
ncbi:ABC transporter permease [Ornithinimicrobium sp. INDO-MA30-4]|uniref:ABC transporter permease n=1 Tax=Ornithinimicrobium sp. INDO-MA30-4 TaxID=2908651 RepID=UPI001F3DF69A|nr:ABC transporter permease [Ornithinimicrobium sp. INDO-MA30-4]UJH70589.1 ABC transporter permease [Ornithinimicrobium sp. INDO-MA30-4]